MARVIDRIAHLFPPSTPYRKAARSTLSHRAAVCTARTAFRLAGLSTRASRPLLQTGVVHAETTCALGVLLTDAESVFGGAHDGRLEWRYFARWRVHHRPSVPVRKPDPLPIDRHPHQRGLQELVERLRYCCCVSIVPCLDNDMHQNLVLHRGPPGIGIGGAPHVRGLCGAIGSGMCSGAGGGGKESTGTATNPGGGV